MAIAASLLFIVSLVALVPTVIEAKDLETRTEAMGRQLEAAREEVRELEARRKTAEAESQGAEQALATRRGELTAVERDLGSARDGLEEAKKVKADADAAVRAARDGATAEARTILERAQAEADIAEKKRKAAEERVSALEASERT